MSLPHAELAVVSRDKIVDYLLSAAHPRGKAGFFGRLGYSVAEWGLLAAALARHARDCPVTGPMEQSVRNALYCGGSLALPRRAVARGPFGVDRRGGRADAAPDHGLPDGASAMIAEHELVVLTRALPSLGLEAGDVGTVVFVHRGGAAYEVEFATLAGETLGVETLRADAVRRAGDREVLHSRAIA